MKQLIRLNSLFIQPFVLISTALLTGLIWLLSSHPVQAQITYSTPGLYTYTVPAGGPYQIRVTARGGDGGGRIYSLDDPQSGGVGATVSETFTVQTGDVLTLIVGQSGGDAFIINRVPSNGGAVVGRQSC